MNDPSLDNTASGSGEPTVPGFDPVTEDAYWRSAYANQPGYVQDYTYDKDYAIAYRIGYQGRHRHKGTYEEHENDLGVEWERIKGESRLTGAQAKVVIRNAWDRVERQMAEQGTLNRDHIRNDVMDGESGAEIAGTGVGAATGAAAGAGIGALAGPLGMAAGAAIGAVVGGIAGSSATETITPNTEDDYWRAHFANRPSDAKGHSYDEDYAVAYRLGYEGRNFYKTTFEDNEADLKQDWERLKGNSRLTWEQAKTAMRAAWDRIEREMPVNKGPAPE